MIYLAYSIGAAIIIFAAFIIDADRFGKKEMETEKKAAEAERIQKAENEAWVNELISNIKDQSDELVN